MTYYAITNPTTLARAPRVLRVDGHYVADPPAETYAAQGYHPLREQEPPAAGEGKVVVFDRYELSDGAIVRVWREEDAPVPVHTYRRSYLAQWLYANGFWDRFGFLLSASADAEFYWDTSTEFDSDHPAWPSIFAGVKTGLGLTDEQAAAFLAFGETGQAAQ